MAKQPKIKDSLASLHSAIEHLHTLGFAHSDLNPSNIHVVEDLSPILIDFDSARKVREKLSTSRGMEGKIGRLYDFRHKTCYVCSQKLRAWLSNPTF